MTRRLYMLSVEGRKKDQHMLTLLTWNELVGEARSISHEWKAASCLMLGQSLCVRAQEEWKPWQIGRVGGPC